MRPIVLGAVAALLVSATGAAVTAQEAQRQTRLILPGAVPGVRPVLVPQTGLSGEPRVAGFSPDGRYLVTGGWSGDVVVREATTLRVKTVLRGHHRAALALAFSMDGTQLATVSASEALVWRIGLGPVSGGAATAEAIGQCTARLAPWPTEVDWVAIRNGADLVEHPLAGAAFSPDGQLLVTCGWELVLWNLSTGEITARVAPGDLTEGVGFTASGTKVVARRTHSPTAIVWDLRTGKLSSAPLPGAIDSKAVTGRGAAPATVSQTAPVASDPDSRPAVRLKLDNRPDRLTALFDGRGRSLAWRTGQATCRVSQLDDVIAAADPGAGPLAYRDLPGIPLWFVDEGRRLLTLGSNPAYAAATAQLSGAERAFMEQMQESLGLQSELAAFMANPALWYESELSRALSRAAADPRRASERAAMDNLDGRAARLQRVANVMTMPRNLLRTWNLTSGMCVRESPLAAELKDLLAVRPDGAVVAGLEPGPGGTLWVLAALTGQVRAALQQTANGIGGLGFSGDGRFLASLLTHPLEHYGRSTGKGWFAWDLTGGAAPRSLSSRKLPGGGDWVASPGELAGAGYADPGHPATCQSPDGRLEARCSWTGDLTLREVAGGREITWLGHRGESNRAAVAFSPDGKLLASGTQAGETKLWRVPPPDATPGAALPTPTELATLVAMQDGEDWIVATPEGYYDCSPGADGYLVWLLGDELYPAEQFSERFRRPDLVRRALRGEGTSGAPPLDASLVPPRVAFAAPQYGATVAEATVSVSLEAVGQRPISRIELRVAGRPLTGEAAGALEWEGSTETRRAVTVTVPLPPGLPAVRLQATACDAEGLRSGAEELLILRPGAQPATGARLHVLALGVSKYKNPAWNTIRYADADATAFAQGFLAANPSLQPTQVGSGVLINEQVTASTVRFVLRGLKDGVNESDVLVLFVAGHGVATADGSYYYLCHDSSEADLPNTALPWKEFVSLLREVRATRIMLFVDTCHSGSVTGYDQVGQSLDLLNRQAGAMVFAASGGDEPSLERDDWGHGAFTRALLEGLAGAADTPPEDHAVTLQELKAYTVRRVGELTAGAQHPCLPRLQDFEPESVMARPRRP